MGTIDTLLRVKADASQAVTGLKPLQTTLDQTAASAKTTETALKGLDGTHKVTLNTQAIDNAAAEIKRLREQMRDQLSIDVNADTRAAQTRIRQLQSSIKTLQQDDHEVAVDVVVNEGATGGLTRGALSGLAQGAASSALGALPGKLGAIGGAARAAAPMVEEAGIAVTGLGAAATGVGIVVGLPILAGILVDFGFKASAAAADVESTQASLNSLTGGKGVETLKFLQSWAKATPFELDQATQAFQLLASAGVPLDQMTSDLNNLGNAAAATQTNLGALTLPVSQMLSSGKASFENIQQLVELAHVPAWDLLAKKLGLSVGEVQKLASEGKLGKDAVQLLINEMGKKFPTGMSDQMGTLNGQLSSLQDTMTQVKQTISAIFLPAMKGITPALQDLADIAQNVAVLWVAAVKKITDNPIAEGALLPLKVGIEAIHLVKEGSDQAVQSLGLADEKNDLFTGGVADSTVTLDDAAAAAQAYADKLRDLQQAVEDTTDALGDIGVNIRTRISFIISQDDAREAINKAIAGTPASKGVEGVPAVTLPANLNVTQITGLGDPQQELIENLASFAQSGLEEGARRAKLDPNFDVRAFDLNVRRQTGQLLIKAGVDPKQVNRVLDNVIGIPRTAIITAALKSEKAQRQLDHFLHPHRVPVVPFIDEKTAKQHAKASNLFNSILTGGSVDGKKAPVSPEVDPKAETKSRGTLDDIAKPGGIARPAPLKPIADPSSLRSLRQILKSLTDPATKTIYLKTVPLGPSGAGGPGRDNPDLVRQGRNLAPSSAATPSGGGSTSRAQTTQLAPRSTPVKVYLDGEEIATKTVTRIAANQPTSSIRRSA